MPTLKSLFFGTKAVFECAYPVDEAVLRLSKVVSPFSFSALLDSGVIGKVSAKKVTIGQHSPMFRGSFNPVFVGSFKTLDGKVSLAGRFSFHWTTWLFMLFFLGILLSGLISSILEGHATSRSVLSQCAMILVGLIFLPLLSSWLGQREIEHLSELIHAAIGENHS